MNNKEIKKELKDIVKYTKRRDDYAADCVSVELLEATLDLISKQETKITDYKQRYKNVEERYTILVQSAAESSKKKTKAAKTDVLRKVIGYINDKITQDYDYMSDSVNYLTINIQEFEDFIDELIKGD